MQFQAPGSAKLRALVEPYINQGVYPPTHELGDGEAEVLSEKDRSLLIELFELGQEEEKVGVTGEIPQKDSPWANVREEICAKVQEVLDSNPDLLTLDMVQQHAVDKGAIPDPDEDSHMQYYRMPDWKFAHWACGSPIRVKSGASFCPKCDKQQSSEFWPYGGQGEDLDDVALLLNGLGKRCAGCNQPTKNKFLKDDKCPVCRGTTSAEPGRRDYGTNGGIRCDVASGPCSCGAWH